MRVLLRSITLCNINVIEYSKLGALKSPPNTKTRIACLLHSTIRQTRTQRLRVYMKKIDENRSSFDIILRKTTNINSVTR